MLHTLSLSHLAHTPTCLVEEMQALSEFSKDVPARRKEFRGMLLEFPNLRKFLTLVEARLDRGAMNTLWFRIWLAMKTDSENGSSATLEALGNLSDFDPSSIDYPPLDCEKPILHYIKMMEQLVKPT